MIVKALSLWEPWASAMRYGWKRIETRSWWTGYQGPLLICASKRWTRETREDAEFIFDVAERRLGKKVTREVHPGKAVALVRLMDCVETISFDAPNPKHRIRPFYHPGAPQGSLERDLGNYDPGRYGWITAPICLDFEPFPVRGAQGLFEVELPPELAARVREVACG